MRRRIVSSTLLIFFMLLMSTLTLSMQARPAFAQETVLRVIPETIELGPENVTGYEFKIAAVVEDVEELSGFDIQFSWDTAYLEYMNHTATVPAESFPAPNPPSPHGGILASPALQLKDEVDEEAGTYWVAFATLGTDTFAGNGTAFVMAFKVIDQPGPGEDDVVLNLDFFVHDLAAPGGIPIPHVTIDGTVILYAPTVIMQTMVFFNINPNPSTVGQTVTLRGILIDENADPLGGETIRLYAKPTAGSWISVTSLTTNGGGIFTWQSPIPVAGTFIFAAYYPGSESYESSYNLAALIVQ